MNKYFKTKRGAIARALRCTKESCYLWLLSGRVWEYLPDSVAIRLKFKRIVGEPLHLRHPQTFNEKLQWLKLHDRNPLHTQMADKYEARRIVTERIGEQYLVPLLGVYDAPGEIGINSLPDRFVMKCTHDFGSVVVCRGKNGFDFDAAKGKLAEHLKRNYYLYAREWPYKNIMPRIVIEQYLADDDTRDELTDYKFYCFGGRSDIVMVCADRPTGNTSFYYFDRDWRFLDYCSQWQYDPGDKRLRKPEQLDTMFELAQRLSAGTRFMRVDLYVSYGRIYFGEMTFFPSGGLDFDIDPRIDRMFGEMLVL